MENGSAASVDKLPNALNAPLAPGDPVLGQLRAALRGDMLKVCCKMYQEHGPVFRIKVPGFHLIVLAGLEANRFFQEHGADYCSNEKTFERIPGELKTELNPSSLDGDLHRRVKRVIAPSLSPQALTPYIGPMMELAQQTIRSWQPNQILKTRDALAPLVLEAVSLGAANRPIEAHHHEMFLYFDMFTVVLAGEVFPSFVRCVATGGGLL